MKRIYIGLLITSLLCIFVTGCSDKASQKTNDPMQTKPSIEQKTDTIKSKTSSKSESLGNDTSNEFVNKEEIIDLTVLSSTMIFAEVYNMMVIPEDYNGRTVKIKGEFAVYHDTENNKNYYAVIISDEAACCQQGLEFVLGDDYKYPDDYPTEGTEVTVTGTFGIYEEDGYKNCHLTDAKMMINE